MKQETHVSEQMTDDAVVEAESDAGRTDDVEDAAKSSRPSKVQRLEQEGDRPAQDHASSRLNHG